MFCWRIVGEVELLHEVGAVGLERAADLLERRARAGHVVDDVEGGDQVVAARDALGCVADFVAHAAGEASSPGVGVGRRDGRRVGVEADQGGIRVALGEEEQRLAVAAADIGHRSARPEGRVHLGHRGDPVLHEVVAEGGAGEALEAAHPVRAVGRLRHPAARLEGLGEQIEIGVVGLEHREGAGEIEGAVGVGQDEGVLRRQAELLRAVVVGEIAVAGHRAEPFARVALGDAGAGGERGAGGRAALDEVLPQAEAIGHGAERAHLGGGDVAQDLERERAGLLHVEYTSCGHTYTSS
ncbi:MAG: hypothetical protein U0841_16405 [Chloroflexia bacterium]